MRFPLPFSFLLALFLTSCANQGVVMQKFSRPHPLYHSLGIEGLYTFVLRDQAGALHEQMVTPEVFQEYAIGQFFSDLQPIATNVRDNKGERTIPAPIMSTPEPVPALRVSARGKNSSSIRTAARSLSKKSHTSAALRSHRSTRHVAMRSGKTHKTKHQLAAKSSKKSGHRALAKSSSHKKPTSVAARTKVKAKAGATSSNELVFIPVARGH